MSDVKHTILSHFIEVENAILKCVAWISNVCQRLSSTSSQILFADTASVHTDRYDKHHWTNLLYPANFSLLQLLWLPSFFHLLFYSSFIFPFSFISGRYFWKNISPLFSKWFFFPRENRKTNLIYKWILSTRKCWPNHDPFI